MKIKDVINVLYPIKNVLEIKNESSNIECPNPSHNDSRPSAHVYKNKVWCFKCSKFYFVSDICEYLNLDINVLYKELEDTYGCDLKDEYNKNRDIVSDLNKNILKRGQNENFITYTEKFFENC